MLMKMQTGCCAIRIVSRMDAIDWMKRRLSASVKQGRGRWLDGVADDVLGAGIYAWLAQPELRLHESGIALAGEQGWRVRYADILDLPLLNLRELNAATRHRETPIRIEIVTSAGVVSVSMHLFDYTAFASTAPKLIELARSPGSAV